MVKRILHLILAIAVVLSLSACATGNNRGNNNRVGMDNTGTGMERLSQQNNNNVIYRDGVYIGYGDAHSNGNESATVVIRNGRIANIDLINVEQQIGANNGAGAGMNNQTGTGIGYTPTPRVVTDNNTDAGSGTRYGTRTGMTGSAAADAINGVRTRLVSAMIRDQRYDVTIVNHDTALGRTIDNWKLAVRRALDQAR